MRWANLPAGLDFLATAPCFRPTGKLGGDDGQHLDRQAWRLGWLVAQLDQLDPSSDGQP
jgi:hypothetical protein